MTGGSERLDIRGDLSELERLFAFLDDFCERHVLPAQLRHDLSLVVEELAVNVIEHGYGGAAGGIGMTLRLISGAVEVLIEDEAPPFDPLEGAGRHNTASAIDDRPIGGLGIHLVKTLTRRCTYRYEGGRNIVGVELTAVRG